ncbi:MAG: rRNA pseudouridine synthase [Bdellovibrionales bacterium]|nr:rRNA pseudouridine synthase [Bdellovibrionales bacterium]
MARERIQKIIAAAGLMSRRKAEEAILLGQVRLNGVVVTELGTQADLAVDRLEVNGTRVSPKTSRMTYAFYKPRGCVTTKNDDRGRRTVMEYFKDDLSLNPVGRLDFESEGLLLMTHDGDLLLKLTHPRYGFQKKYEVKIVGQWKPGFAAKLVAGILLDDGMGRFDEITGGPENFTVVVSEGRNRFVRRMFAALGLEVLTLKRVQMGPVKLDGLKPGERREITELELQAIAEHKTNAPLRKSESQDQESDE